MFRYKICNGCKYYYKHFILFFSVDLFIIYALPANKLTFGLYLMLIIALSIPVIFLIDHHKEHQKEQFSKIKNKFGIK